MRGRARTSVDRGCRRGMIGWPGCPWPRRDGPRAARRGATVALGVARDRPPHRRSPSDPDAAVGNGRNGPAGRQGGCRRRALRRGAGPSPAALASAPSSFRSWSPARGATSRRDGRTRRRIGSPRRASFFAGWDSIAGRRSAMPRAWFGWPADRSPPRARRSSARSRLGGARTRLGGRRCAARPGPVPDPHEPPRGCRRRAGAGHARAQEMGSPPLVARADEIAKASRGRGREKEPWRPLTVREFEVARLSPRA